MLSLPQFIAIGVIVATVLIGAWIYRKGYLLPEDMFIFYERADGSTVTRSRNGIEIQPPPDSYPSNGFEHIEEYIERLLASDSEHASIVFSEPSGEKGFLICKRGDIVEVAMHAERFDDPGKEELIRNYFEALGVDAPQDYLSQNGLVKDSTRNLTYPLPEQTTATITERVKNIMVTLSGMSPEAAMTVRFDEK